MVKFVGNRKIIKKFLNKSLDKVRIKSYNDCIES